MLRNYAVSVLAQTATGYNEDWQFVRPGTIKQIQFTSAMRCTADGSVTVYVALNPVSDAGLVSTSGSGLCDALAVHKHAQDITTTGQTSDSLASVVPCNRKVAVGERIYLGMVVDSGASAGVNATAIITVEESS